MADGPDSVHRNPKGFAALAGMTEAQLVDKYQRDYNWPHCEAIASAIP